MDKQMPKKYEASFVYNEPISRLCTLLIDPKKINELNNKTQLPYLFTDKPVPLQFTNILGEYTSVEYKKKIIWTFESKDIPTPINYAFTMIMNTMDISTLVIFEIVIIKPNLIDPSKQARIIKGCKDICFEVIQGIETLLEMSCECIYEFESCIIQAPIEKVWKYVTETHLFRIFSIENVKYSGPLNQVGTIISWKFLKDQSEGKCQIRIFDKNPKSKEWKYGIEPLAGPHQHQEVLFTLIEVKDNQTFLSFSHKFNEVICHETMKCLETRKIQMIQLIKKDLEEGIK